MAFQSLHFQINFKSQQEQDDHVKLLTDHCRVCGEKLHKAKSIVGTCKYTHKHITLNTFRNLTWHDGALPQEQLWVKLDGDKGHSSFKLNL